MKRISSATTLLCTLLLGLFAAGAAAAQGVTTSAITGRVTNQEGEPVPGAQIVATNTGSGTEYRVSTRSNGRYLLPGMQPGGPYRIDVRALGYAAVARTAVNLALSQTAEYDFVLAPEAIALEGISVTAESNGAIISKGRTGTANVISDSAISRLPTITRDFTDFTRLTPQISTGGAGTSAAGRNNRFNSVQIDGAVNNDLFGLSASGTPGGQAGARPITLEAIQEFQVVIAPFDVRQNGFTGAGINAITKSGTNELDGSIAYYGRNQDLVGNYRIPGGDVSTDVSDFDQSDLAFSAGGPIARDRLFFFVAGERSTRSAPEGAIAGTPTANVTVAEAQEVADYLLNTFGYDAGTIGGLNLERESTNLFGRLDWNINPNNRLTLRHNYVDAFDDNLGRSARVYALGNAGYVFNSRTNSTVAQLNSSFGNGVFNEFRLGYTTVNDERELTQRFPRVEIAYGNNSVTAGPDPFSGLNTLDQEVLELTNDVTLPFGRHSVVVGTNNEFFSFSNLFVANAFGSYVFDSFADLQAGAARRFDYTYPLEGGKRSADFPVRRYGVYAQDTWDVSDRLTLTGGLRYDYLVLPDEPSFNPVVEEVVGIRTDIVPTGTGMFNPRVGFNWDVDGSQETQVRGGLGLFSGRTPYVWISNAYGNTGVDYATFRCSAEGTVPMFVADPDGQPRTCAGATTRLSPNDINTIDPNFNQPQVFRSSLAVDRRLPLGVVGTLEGLYTKTRYDVLYQNLAIVGPTDQIVEGRPVYERQNLGSAGIGSIYHITNTDKGDTYSLTAQLQRPFQDRWSGELAYTYSQANDISPLSSSRAVSNFRFNPVADNPNDPAVGPSNFEVPHRVIAAGTYQATLVPRAPTDFSLIYVGESGRPYSYTYNRTDVNNDGSDANDLLYVPADASEIRFEPFRAPGTRGPDDRGQLITPEESFQNFNSFANSVDCLREARGSVLDRNTCREPWFNRFDLRIAQTLPTFQGQGAQIVLDILNFGNLLNEDWGLNRFVPNQNEALLTATSGTPGEGGRFTYRPFGERNDAFVISNLASRYQIQLGVRYEF